MTESTVPEQRRLLLRRLFPDGVPPLWCPLIAHYRDDGTPDAGRMRAHLRQLAPQVKGFLIPGSTGDGWELRDDETDALLDVAFDLAAELDLHLLVGVLKTTAPEMRAMIQRTLARLRERTGVNEDLEAMCGARVCGFTVCPPRGADLPPNEMREALDSVLQLGVPASLYQLPQVTGNEMPPALVAELAACRPNLILFKDTSGADRVATSGLDFGGVFLVRGAEGGYDRWPKAGGGPYDGFLLSTANGFARQLREVLRRLERGDTAGAAELAGRLNSTVEALFKLVAGLSFGNAFANANKAVDYFMAHGANADAPPPLTHSGNRLPPEVLERVRETLARAALLPECGYLDAGDV